MTDFGQALATFVASYCRERHRAGCTVGAQEMVGSLLGVIAQCLELFEGDEQTEAVAAVHEALNDLMHDPTNERRKGLN